MGIAARALVVLAFAASLVQGNGGTPFGDFTWDDTYIYLASARTLATTGRLAVSAHHPPMVALTSPPYTVVLAALGTVLDLEVAARLFDVALTVATLLLLFDALVLLLEPAAGTLAIAFFLTMVFALSGKAFLMGVGGMETSLYAALFLWLLASDSRRGPGVRTGLIAGALCAVRPDGVLLPALIVARELVRLARDPATRSARSRTLLRFAIPAALPLLVQSALFLHFTGSPLANTIQARTYFVRSICRPFAEKVQAMLFDLGLLLVEFRVLALMAIPAVLGVVTTLRRSGDERERTWRMLVAFLLLFPLPFLFLYPNSAFVYEGRYFAPFVLVLLLLSGRGVAELIEAIRELPRTVGLVFTALLLVVFSLRAAIDLATERARIVAVHRDRLAWDRDYRARIDWINRNTPREARVAVIDLGHPLYFMEREPFDLLGLGNAEMIDYYRDPERGGCVDRVNLSGVTRRFGIDYVMLHTGWAAVVAPRLAGPGRALEKIGDGPASPFEVYRVVSPPNG